MIIVLDEAYRAGSRGRFPRCELRFFPSALSDPAVLAELLSDADAAGLRRVLAFPFDRTLIERAGRLQFIQRSGSGTDWFDVAALSAHGILLGTNSGFNAVSVAEHALTLTLLCLRRTCDFMDAMKRGEWLRDLPGEPPMILSGKTVGIVGVGAIGSRVARMMNGLGARVIAHRRSLHARANAGDDIEWVELDELLQRADIVSLHVPHTPETDKIIGARELALMKPSAILINTARGQVVDASALYEALRNRQIRAAGLDVFENEPPLPNSPLIALDNVLATPHVGGAGVEIAALQVEGTLSNLELFVAGRRPERLANPEILEQGTARAAHLI